MGSNNFNRGQIGLTTLIILAIIVVVGLVVYLLYVNGVFNSSLINNTNSTNMTNNTINNSGNNSGNITGNQTSNTSSTGNIAFIITDKQVNLSNLSNIYITISSIQVHSTDRGWITLSVPANTYDLLALRNGSASLISQLNVPQGSYDQIEIGITNASIVQGFTQFPAKVPSERMRMNTMINVSNNSDKIALTILDFQAENLIHLTGNNKYILSPVIHLRTFENSTISTSNNSVLITSQGKLNSDKTYGMDINGNVGQGVQIPENASLDIEENGTLIINSTNIT